MLILFISFSECETLHLIVYLEYDNEYPSTHRYTKRFMYIHTWPFNIQNSRVISRFFYGGEG